MTGRNVELRAVVLHVWRLLHAFGTCREDDKAQCEMSWITLAFFFEWHAPESLLEEWSEGRWKDARLEKTHIFGNELSTINDRVERVNAVEVRLDEYVCLLLTRQHSYELYESSLECPVVSERMLFGFVRWEESESFSLSRRTVDCRRPGDRVAATTAKHRRHAKMCRSTRVEAQRAKGHVARRCHLCDGDGGTIELDVAGSLSCSRATARGSQNICDLEMTISTLLRFMANSDRIIWLNIEESIIDHKKAELTFVYAQGVCRRRLLVFSMCYFQARRTWHTMTSMLVVIDRISVCCQFP